MKQVDNAQHLFLLATPDCGQRDARTQRLA